MNLLQFISVLTAITLIASIAVTWTFVRTAGSVNGSEIWARTRWLARFTLPVVLRMLVGILRNLIITPCRIISSVQMVSVTTIAYGSSLKIGYNSETSVNEGTAHRIFDNLRTGLDSPGECWTITVSGIVIIIVRTMDLIARQTRLRFVVINLD